MPKMIGTVMPTEKSFALTATYAKRVSTTQEKVGSKIGGTRRTVGGEVRWYKNAKEFAVVSRDGEIKWFEIRQDGYEYAKRS